MSSPAKEEERIACPQIINEIQIHKGKWTIAENKLFFESLIKYGTNWQQLKKEFPERSLKQIKMHVQKFVNLMKKKFKNSKRYNLKLLDNIEKIPDNFFNDFTYDEMMNISLYMEDNNQFKNDNKIFKIEKVSRKLSENEEIVKTLDNLMDIELIPKQLLLFYIQQSLKSKTKKCQDLKKISDICKILKKYELIMPKEEETLNDFPKFTDLSQKFKEQLKEANKTENKDENKENDTKQEQAKQEEKEDNKEGNQNSEPSNEKKQVDVNNKNSTINGTLINPNSNFSNVNNDNKEEGNNFPLNSMYLSPFGQPMPFQFPNYPYIGMDSKNNPFLAGSLYPPNFYSQNNLGFNFPYPQNYSFNPGSFSN